MNKDELVKILGDIASTDLTDGAIIYDHPCSVAVRAITQMNDDINVLRGVLNANGIRSGYSKQVQTLIKMNYDPRF